MAEFKLGRIKFVWQGDWTSSTTYYKDDVVRYGGKTYICVIGHTADSDFYTDLDNVPTRWNQMSDGTEWKGDWTTGTYYKVNDLVKYGGYVYLANEGHTSAATASSGLEADLSKWDLFAESFDYKSIWAPSTRYKINDIVKYGGNSYLCIEGHTSSATSALGLEVDLLKWELYTEGFDWKADWSISTRYKINDLVKYGGITYVCNEGHTSASTVTSGLEADSGKWDSFHRGVEYRGDWSDSAVRYRINDVVKYGAGTWICTTYHSSSISNTFESDASAGKWAQFVEGLEFEDSWNSSTIYQPGDIVTYGGYVYVAKTNHSNQTPSTESDDWGLLSTGFKAQGDWSSVTAYLVGDVIRLNGYTYVAILDHTNQKPPNATYWSRLNSGVYWRGAWADATDYVAGDAARYLNSTYICILAHTSSVSTNRPDLDITGTYWNLIAAGNENDVLTTEGDIVYYAGSGPTRLPIGDPGRVLMSNGTLPGWANFGVVPEVYYVAPHGADIPAPLYGLTIDQPFKTVRYACEQIEKGIVNPNAAQLLRMNRTFIQAEVVEWVQYQIDNPTGIWVGFTNDSEALCRRDIGLILDAIMYDLSHGSNFKTLEATRSYFSGGSLIPAIADEEEQLVEAINYGLEVIDAVISSVPPAANYQSLNSVADPVIQYIDPSLIEESEAQTIIESLAGIITDALTAGSLSNIPQEDRPGYTISVKTGEYEEVLPIILPANTAIVGDELRSTRIGPAGSLIESGDKAKTVEALQRLKTITSDIIQNNAVLPSVGNTETQNVSLKAGSIGSSTAVLSITDNMDEIYDILDNGLGAVDPFTFTDPTGYNIGFLGGYGDARDQLDANRDFIIAEITAWIAVQVAGEIAPFTSSFTYDSVACARDVGYILDALKYDLTYGGNLETTVAARAYFSFGEPVYGPGEKEETLAAYARLKSVVGDVILENAVTVSAGNAETQDTSGTPGSASAASFAQDRIQEIYDTIDDDGTLPAEILPSTSWVAADLLKAFTALQTYKTSIRSDAVQYVKTQHPTLVFDQDVCSRDVGYIVDAISYDLMFGSNFRSIKSGMSYYRGLTSTTLVLGDQKSATLDILTFVKHRALQIGASGAVELADLLWNDVITYIDTGVRPIVTGVNTVTTDVDQIDGAIVLLANKDFLAEEAVAYIEATYPSYLFDGDSCKRDVRAIIDSMFYDIQYIGNYKSVLAARYYRNAYTGSKLEDAFYVRNACGLRNMTFFGLDGTSDGDTTGLYDALLPANAYGTQRPRAGAYVSLDPGWGPNDDRAWTTNKSTYVQNVTTFGTGCTGQKIDGILHNGGNDSIVSNDFTQVLSDGVGAWVTNLGRAELVSVFTYYNYAGYLAENGGKIRATNGNNSYGTFGSIAEGVDITETAITGLVDNRSTESDVRNVLTNGAGVLMLEYGNAGIDYTDATYTISGTGSGATPDITGEIRSGGVFNLRLTDPGDSSGPGGTGYVTAANLAQTGSSTEITLAATDTNSSLAYIGMSIYIISGTGAGQYGYIDTYNAGSKVATVRKESDGTAGWDHLIPGTTIASSLDVTTSYSITPRLVFSDPPYSKEIVDSLGSTQAWSDVAWGSAYALYTEISASSTSGSGSLASFNVTRNDGVYTVTVVGGGILYEVDDTLTILGTSLGGATPANDLVLTVTKTSSGGGGAITEVTVAGTAVSGKFVAVSKGGDTSSYSSDGVTWSNGSMPSSADWTAITYGKISNVGYWMAVASGSDKAAYSTDGINWTATTLPSSANWSDVTYGNGRFVAIVSGATTSAYATAVATWSSMGALPSPTTWVSVTYGAGRFMAVATGGTSAAYSTNGTTWTASTLPASANWIAVSYGNSRFVAVANGSDSAAYSLNGTSWTSSTLPASLDYTDLRYGNGVFYAVADNVGAASSSDGFNWTARNNSHASITVTATEPDIIGTFSDGTLPSSVYWTNITNGNNNIIAVGNNQSDTGYAAISTNGTSWTALTVPSTAGWEFSAVASNGTNKYVIFINGDRDILTSTDATTWTVQSTAGVNNLPAARTWSDAIYGDKFVVIANSGTNPVAFSSDATTWTQGTLSSGSWSSIAYGDIGGTDYYVIVSGSEFGGSQAAAYSTDGQTWTSGNTLPSSAPWSAVTYGLSTFVAVAGDTSTATTTAAYSTNGTTWTAATLPGAAAKWTSVSFGGNAFMAFAYDSNRTAVSEDGITWVEGPAISSGNWKASTYNFFRFVAIRTAGSDVSASIIYRLNTNYLTTADTTDLSVNDILIFSATTIGGLSASTEYYIKEIVDATNFTISSTPGGSSVNLTSGTGSMPGVAGKLYTALAYGNPGGAGRWIALPGDTGDTNSALKFSVGTKARARAYVTDNILAEVWIHEPGSGYVTSPTMTITDPNNTGADATYDARIGNGVLAQPNYGSRGINYTAASCEISGTGYADRYQVGTYVYVKNLSDRPLPGSNLQINGIDDVYYRIVTVTEFLGLDPGPYTARLQISPAMGTLEAPNHEEPITIRIRYSQVRLTGHDFLDIGTGNQTLTNYPALPLQDPDPANETVDVAGGRVFYTSTDQDGNFRVGGLFNVEQATGVATLNADAFNIAGLQELQLGSVALGGSGATITEFSTDPFFTADSDEVVPTQRAIKAYITSQIGGGESSLNVNTLTAGIIYIAGSTITTTTSAQININTKMNFTGGVDGAPLALNYFLLR